MSQLNEIRTSRLLLRQWREADKIPFYALNSDPQVMTYFPALLSLEQSDAVADRVQARIAEKGWGFWAVEELASGEFTGFVGLNLPPL